MGLVKKIKNTSGGPKTWRGQEIADGAYYTIQSEEEKLWMEDTTLLADITGGDAVVNDGTSDLSAAAGTIHLQAVNATFIQGVEVDDSAKADGLGLGYEASSKKLKYGFQKAISISDFESAVTANASVAANTAKTSNANHTGEVTGDTSLTVDKTVITNKSLVTGVGADHILVADDSDSDNLKKMLLSDVLGGGTDAAAIHKSTAAEISTIAEKTTPVGDDLLLIEDSAASNVKKKIKVSNLPGNSKLVTIVKASDEVLASNDTLQDDDELKLAILNGETWAFEFLLIANEATGNPNIKFRLGATGGLTGNIEYQWSKLGTTIAGGMSDFTTDSGSIALTTVKDGILITGSIKATANGTLQLQWAQATSDTDATTVFAMSKLIATKV